MQSIAIFFFARTVVIWHVSQKNHNHKPAMMKNASDSPSCILWLGCWCFYFLALVDDRNNFQWTFKLLDMSNEKEISQGSWSLNDFTNWNSRILLNFEFTIEIRYMRLISPIQIVFMCGPHKRIHQSDELM